MHILLITAEYTGANKNRMSTVVDISALRVKLKVFRDKCLTL